MTSKFCFSLGILIGNHRTRKKQIFLQVKICEENGP